MRVYRFFASMIPSKPTLLDRESNCGPNRTIFRLNTDQGVDSDKKYTIFAYKKRMKNPVFRPKLNFWLDDCDGNDVRSACEIVMLPLFGFFVQQVVLCTHMTSPYIG